MARKLEFETDRELLYMDVLAGILVLAIFLAPGLKALRVVLGIPFVLFFPGYALVSALFPGKKDLEGIERIALSLGLSLALVPLIGLALNYTPFGIRLYPVTLSLFLLMLGMTWTTRLRRGNLPPKERFTVGFSARLPSWSETAPGDKLFAVGCVMALIGVGVGVSYLASTPRHGESFTEFYVLGPGGMMENYPTDLEVGETGTIILGVINHEYQDENYHISLTLDNEPLKEIENIQLGHGENWEEEVNFQVLEAGENKKLDFLLYRDDSGEPYRKLHLWLTVRGAE